MTSSDTKVLKRRKRCSYSCDNCKRKKVKCDKASPCSQCVKASTTSTCIYSPYSNNRSGNGQSLPYMESARKPLSFQDGPKDAKRRSVGPQVEIPKSELEILKSRLKQIESSLNGSIFPSSTPEKVATPVQLPPMNNIGHMSMPGPLFESRSVNSVMSIMGVNPCNPDDTMNFFENYTPISENEPEQRNYGPFAYSSLMKKDPGLRIVGHYIYDQNDFRSEGSLLFGGTAEVTAENTRTLVASSEKTFEKKELETQGYDNIVPYNNLLRARLEKGMQKSLLNKEGMTLGLTFFEGRIDRELQLIDKIQMILPRRKVIWKLLDRFFSSLYPYMPYLDEFSLTEDVGLILGPKSYKDEKIGQIKVEKKLDLATVGLLLVILRLAYLSLFCNNNSVNKDNLTTMDPEKQEIKYLLQNPISIETIDVAKLCLDQFQIFRKTNFTVLQLTLFIRLYHTYAPEDGDGTDAGDVQILNAMLVQMAYSLGLNREPTKFKGANQDARQNNLGRKIWYSLVIWDTYLSYAFGTPMCVDKAYYDTKIPYCEAGSENVRDVEFDQYVTQSHFSCLFVMSRLKKILTLVLNVEDRFKMPELCSLLSEFEVTLHENFGTLGECLKPLNEPTVMNTFPRNYKTKYYLSLKAFFISIFFHFYLYYKGRDELSFFYLRKVLLITTCDIMPHYYDLLGNSDVVCDMMINPTLEQVIHKTIQTYLALIVSCNFSIYRMKNDPDHDNRRLRDIQYCYEFRLLCRLSSCYTRCAEVAVSAVSKISNRYYYAWRITKGHTFLLKTVTSTKFYEQMKVNQSLSFNTDQVKELIRIAEDSLKKVGYSSSSESESLKFCKNMVRTANDTKTYDETFNTRHGPRRDSPSSDTSGSTSDNNYTHNDNISSGFGFDFVDNASIDLLWHNLLSVKQSDNYTPATPEVATPGLKEGTPFERVEPDMFDMLLDRLFNLS